MEAAGDRKGSLPAPSVFLPFQTLFVRKESPQSRGGSGGATEAPTYSLPPSRGRGQHRGCPPRACVGHRGQGSLPVTWWLVSQGSLCDLTGLTPAHAPLGPTGRLDNYSSPWGWRTSISTSVKWSDGDRTAVPRGSGRCFQRLLCGPSIAHPAPGDSQPAQHWGLFPHFYI